MHESARVFRFGVFEVDVGIGELRKQGLRIRLQEQPFQLLLMLLERSGEVVTREEIRRKLWPPDTFVDFDQGVGTALKKLRQALGDDSETPLYIETIPKRGYRFIMPVERFPAAAPAQISKPEVSAPASQRPHRRRTKAVIAAAAVALAALAVAGLWFYAPKMPPPSRPIPLTTYEGDQLWPDFSPDGNQVVFSWDGAPDGKFHLYVKLVGEANLLQLTRGRSDDIFPAWSPDGRWIAFLRWDGTRSHVLLVPPLGGPERRIGDGACEGNLALAPTPGSAALDLSWSSDSQWIACSSPDGGLILLSVLTGEARRLTTPPPGQRDLFPAFSPDGRNNLLFEREVSFFDCDLHLLRLNEDLSPSGQPHRITNEHGGRGGLAWTADGREAIWASFSFSTTGISLYRVPVLHRGEIQLLSFEYAFYPAVARRQNRLVYVRSSFDSDIWRAAGHSIERHPVSSTEPDELPHLSPDGKRIVFASNRSGPMEIWVANSDGTDPIPLTNLGQYSYSPSWSPDGQWIVFNSIAADSSSNIWVIDSSGGTPRRLTSDPGGFAYTPSFSSTGKWVYFTGIRTGRPEILRIPFAGGQAMQVTHKGGESPLESSDGKTVYYLKNSELFHVPATGGEERPLGLHLIQDDFEVVPEGIYYIAQTHGNRFRGGEIRFYDFATRSERLVQPLGNILFLYGFTVSPDRKTFLFSGQRGTTSNLMLVENFR